MWYGDDIQVEAGHYYIVLNLTLNTYEFIKKEKIIILNTIINIKVLIQLKEMAEVELLDFSADGNVAVKIQSLASIS